MHTWSRRTARIHIVYAYTLDQSAQQRDGACRVGVRSATTEASNDLRCSAHQVLGSPRRAPRESFGRLGVRSSSCGLHAQLKRPQVN